MENREIIRFGEYTNNEQIRLMSIDYTNFRYISNPTERTYITAINQSAKYGESSIVFRILKNDDLPLSVEISLLNLHGDMYIAHNKVIKNEDIKTDFLGEMKLCNNDSASYIAFSLFVFDNSSKDIKDKVIDKISKCKRHIFREFFGIMTNYRELFTKDQWLSMIKSGNGDVILFIDNEILDASFQVEIMKINVKNSSFIPEEIKIPIIKKYDAFGATCTFDRFLEIENG